MDDEDLRIFACDIIQSAGMDLKLPQIAMTTGQMLLQRVYHTPDYTFDHFHLDVTAMAALFLAAKIEEYPKKAKEVMDAVRHALSTRLNREIKLTQSEQEKLREELITTERRILKYLGFNLLSSHPYKILVSYYHIVVRQLDPEQNVWKERDNQRLVQIAWNYCNDSFRSDVFIKFTKEAVACACIQLACEDTKILFPRSTDGREWYDLFNKDGQEVERAMKMIRSLYLRPKPNPHDLKRYLYLARRV